jgi:hypothetical protein
MLNDLKDLREEQEKIRKELHKRSEEIFQKYSKELFIKYPEMKRFSWTQYTPYFNDGDTCEFGAQTDPGEISINGIDGWDAFEIQYPQKADGRYDYTKPTYVNSNPEDLDLDDEKGPLVGNEAYLAISELLGAIGEDNLKQMFEEGEVVVTPNGVEVEDYDHE